LTVAFVGIVSNIQALCTKVSWLAWLCTIPGPVVNIIQGILPTVLLAILFALLPIVLRLLARFEGIPQRTGVELSLMDRFFLFLVIVRFYLSFNC
jgi:calcium permeable stress-gated cation channel